MCAGESSPRSVRAALVVVLSVASAGAFADGPVRSGSGDGLSNTTTDQRRARSGRESIRSAVLDLFSRNPGANHPPRVELATVGGSDTPYGHLDLEAVVAFSDPDGDAITAEAITWYVNDEALPAAGRILAESWFDRGDVVHFEVVAFDGRTWSAAVASEPLSILNAPPEIVSIGGVAPSAAGLSFTAVEASDWSLPVEAHDPDGDLWTLELSGLPPGASAAEGAIVWTPGYDDAGQYAAVLSVGDGATAIEVAIQIEVDDTNRGPELEPWEVPTCRELAACTVRLAATDPDGDPLVYLAEGLPEGAHLDGDTGLVTWTPADGQSGLHQWTVIAMELHDAPIPVSATVDLRVDDLHVLTTDDGLRLGLDPDGRLVHLGVEENLIPDGATAGFYLIDLAAGPLAEVTAGGFVDDGTGAPSGWFPSEPDAVALAAREGTSRLALRAETAEGSGALTVGSQPIVLQHDEPTYRVEVDVRTEAGYLGVGKDWDPYLQAAVDVHWRDAGGATVAVDRALRVAYSTESWKRLGTSLSVPAGAVEATVELVVDGAVPNAPGATVWFDDVCFGPDPARRAWPLGSVHAETTDTLVATLEDPDSGLAIEARLTAAGEHVRIDADAVAIAGAEGDRALELGFAVPLPLGDGDPWRWWDHLRGARELDTPEIYEHVVNADATGWLPLSVFPFSAVEDGRRGLGLAWPMAEPRIARTRVEGASGLYAIEFSLGLSAATERFPNRAAATFQLYALERPEWGLRSSLERYYAIQPEAFAPRTIGGEPLRTSGEGLWADQQVDDPDALNVRYVMGRFHTDEGRAALDYGASEGLVALSYTRPWDVNVYPWLLDGPPPDYPTVIDELHANADGGAPGNARIQAALTSLGRDTQGDVVLHRLDEAIHFEADRWNAQVPVNLDPEIEADCNAAQAVWEHDLELGLDTVATDHPGTPTGWWLDGFFVSSAHLDSDRERFATADLPLAYASNTRTPASHLALRNVEFLDWIGRTVESVSADTFSMANVNSVGLGTLGASWVDVLAYELDAEASVDVLVDQDRLYRRVLARHRPVLEIYTRHPSSTLWESYEAFESDYLRPLWHALLLYGIHPSAVSAMVQLGFDLGPAEELYAELVPIVSALQEAGWQPVPHAFVDDPKVYVERYDDGERRFLSIYNRASGVSEVEIEIDLDGLGLEAVAAIEEWVDGGEVDWQVEGRTLRVHDRLEGRASHVLHLVSAPTP